MYIKVCKTIHCGSKFMDMLRRFNQALDKAFWHILRPHTYLPRWLVPFGYLALAVSPIYMGALILELLS